MIKLFSEMRVLVCVNEFFGEWNTAWGGYGFLARELLPKAIGIKPENFHICLGRSRGFFLKKFFAPETKKTEEGYLLIKLPRVKTLAARIVNSYDLIISIEDTVPFVFSLKNKIKKKILFWIQDPRPKSDWDEIASMTLASEACYYDQTAYDTVRECFHLGKLNFATQGHYLADKAKLLYGLPNDTPVSFLPNPIEINYDIGRRNDKKNSIIFLGRLDSVKRGWIFCEIAKRLPQYEFNVLGASSNITEQKMNHYVADCSNLKNLHFLGRCFGEAKRCQLISAKILVNTSIHEALPISFLEAFAYGVTVVSNQDPDGLTSKFGIATGKSIGDGFDSVDSFVKAISYLMEHEEERYEKAKAAYDYIRSVHSVENFKKVLSNLF